MCCLVEIQLVGLSYMSTGLKLLNHCHLILFTTFFFTIHIGFSFTLLHIFSFFVRLDIWFITVQPSFLSVKYSNDANMQV